MTSVTAAVSRAPGRQLVFEELTLGTLHAEDVLVAVEAAAICHTDINVHRANLAGGAAPLVLGHEGFGTVVAVGDSVRGVDAGDRVLMTATSCGTCAMCLAGRPSYCSQSFALNFAGNRPDGNSAYQDSDVRSHFFGQSSFATLAVAGWRNVVPVPQEIPSELAVALGCGTMTGAGTVLLALGVTAGSSLVIFGAGAVGLAAVMAGVVAGASTVIAVDTVESRLRVARELGATATVLANQDTLPTLRELTGGGAMFSIEASGHPAAMHNAIECLAQGGRCAAVGTVNDDVSFSWRDLRLKGATIRGVAAGDANPKTFLPLLFNLHRSGRFPVDKLVRTYEFTEINKAMDDSESGSTVKPVLKMI